MLSNRLAKFVKNKGSLVAIVAAENYGVKAIMDSGGSYASMEKTSISVFRKYIDSIVADKSIAEKLKNDRKLIGEIADMIVSDCGAVNVLVDDIIAAYSAKYGK